MLKRNKINTCNNSLNLSIYIENSIYNHSHNINLLILGYHFEIGYKFVP